jgi:prepilin-type N-terminal cleavage/methylation domain-containing protein/prepilin-type processing-associated H-X9-DG protein
MNRPGIRINGKTKTKRQKTMKGLCWRKTMKTREEGFTLVELLVVIAIIALLMSILMPSLARVRVIANRMKCGSHLADIGKAMLMYAEENRQSYPRGGLRNSIWSARGYILSWDAKTRELAFDSDGTATVTSCFYLLIRLGNMSPKQFNCPDDADVKEFRLSDFTTNIKELTAAWDFGDDPGHYCSYSYQMPFTFIDNTSGTNTPKNYSMDTTSSPGNPLCGDRNPYLDKNAVEYLKNYTIPNPYLSLNDGVYCDDKLKGNAAAHSRKAQNVLFNDGHVTAESFPNCGIDYDNIWKYWPNINPTDTEREIGKGTKDSSGAASTAEIFSYTPSQGTALPKNKDDNCLVNERNDNKE